MGVSEGHLPRCSHEVLQVLPRHCAAQVLHHHTILGARGQWVPLEAARGRRRREGRPVAGRCAGALHAHAVANQAASVELVHRIVSIPRVIKLHKCKTILQDNLPKSPIAFEEFFYISISHTAVYTTNVYTCSRHTDLCWNHVPYNSPSKTW